jgi:L-fuconate dehydratase
MFKQLLQAAAIDFLQMDNCRLGGLNEAMAVLLLAAKFNVPVCPHAGGIGLCEYGQHLSLIDYVCVSGSLDRRMLEFADHLHEHFVDPIATRNGHYVAPTAPGFSIEMHPASLDAMEFPIGSEWRMT